MKKRIEKKPYTISGIITPSEWDDNYKVVKVKISLSGEREYALDLNKKGEELLTRTGHKLKVTGRLHEDGQGNEIISLDDYEIIDF